MQVAILGPLQVRTGDRQLSITGTRLRALITRLAVDAPKPVSVAELVGAVWPDEPPADPINALQSLVSRVRRTLGDATRIQQVAGGYRLTVEPGDVDAAAFEEWVAAGRRDLHQDRADDANEHLTQALSLWRGEPLVDAADGPYAAAARLRLDELRLDAQTDLIEARLRLGRAGEAVADLESLVAAHPLRERLAAQLMRALATTGRQADALSVYERLRDRLAGELGVDPSAEVQAVHLAVLRGEILAAPTDPRPDRRHTNLRVPLTRLIGRDREVERITELLTGGRLVTIVGPGGAGKTRLAQEIGMTIAAEARDGVWLIELAAVTEAKGIVPAMIGALGLLDTRAVDRRSERSARDSIEYLFDVLGDADCLLVVDNCEHLVATAAELIDALLARSPGLRVLATSREPLGIVGEALCLVPPLGLPPIEAGADQVVEYPSVRLLVERGRAVFSEFEVHDGNVADVIEIVRRLDGLPLAIELAAARLRVMPIAEITARLSDRFRLLTGGSRTAMPRHRTLRAVVEWSWDLLAADERLLAERLAVFPAGVTVEAASAVCADDRLPADVIPDLMLSLVDKSLLAVADGAIARYRMLETIREYGVERLAERGEADAARAAHARYYAGLAHDMDPLLRTSDQLAALATLNVERNNIGAALRFLAESQDPLDRDACMDLALDMSWYWQMIGAEAETSSWMAVALGAIEGREHPGRLWAQATLDLVRAFIGGWPSGEAAQFRAASGRLAQELVEVLPPPRPGFAMLPAILALFGADAELAERIVQDGLRSGDPWTAATLRTSRAMFAENDGDVERVRANVDAALAGFEQIGDRWGMSSVLAARGNLRALDGDTRGGIEDYERAMGYARELGSGDDEAMLRMRLAGLLMRTEDLPRAAALIDEVQQEMSDRSYGFDRGLFAGGMAAMIRLMSGDVDGAQELADRLRQERAHRGPYLLDGHAAAVTCGVTAIVAVHAGRIDLALADVRSGYPLAVRTEDMPVVATLGVALAWVAAAAGHPARAARALGAAATLRGSDDFGDPMLARLIGRLRGELAEGFDDYYRAGKALCREDALGAIDPERVLGDVLG